MMIGTEPGNFKNEKGVLDTLMLLGISRGTPNAPFDPFGEWGQREEEGIGWGSGEVDWQI